MSTTQTEGSHRETNENECSGSGPVQKHTVCRFRFATPFTDGGAVHPSGTRRARMHACLQACTTRIHAFMAACMLHALSVYGGSWHAGLTHTPAFRPDFRPDSSVSCCGSVFPVSVVLLPRASHDTGFAPLALCTFHGTHVTGFTPIAVCTHACLHRVLGPRLNPRITVSIRIG